VSRENVEALEAGMAAVQRGDWDAAMELYDPAVELDQTRMPGGARYQGRGAAWRFYSDWFGAWRDLRFEFERVIDAGDEVVVITRMSGRGRVTGAEVSIRAADVYTFRDGKIVRHAGYPDATEALNAVGLEE
jgi:ketosteroid isomerase-like protein